MRIGDGCWDSKRGGCKCAAAITSRRIHLGEFISAIISVITRRYVKSFADVVRHLRSAGIHSGTIFLATDNGTARIHLPN